jgi:hypothetical protein
MLYVIHCLDRPGAMGRRLEHRAEHKHYLKTAGVKLVLSGPLVKDDGETMIGSFFLVDVTDRAAAEAFNRADPFSREKVWGTVRIDAFQDLTAR